MLYGKIERHEEVNFVGGIATRQIIRYDESIKVTTSEQAQDVLKQMLDQHGLGELVDPAIKIETDTVTGKIKRVVKSWTDPQSRLHA